MKDSAHVLHTTQRDRFRHFNFLLLLLPSMAFVLVLSFFLRNKFAPMGAMTQSSVSMERTKITVKDTEVMVGLAKTEAQHEQGLSGVTTLADTEGMLFVFTTKTHPPFWMKDMLIPLDFLWISDGKVVQISKDVPAPAFGTPDNQLKLIIPNDPINYVLEVNAGFTDSHQIEVGDSVTIP